MDEETVTAEHWSEAAEAYSEIVRKQLNSDERKVWLDLVYRYAPKKDRLKVLDIGTGPGFFTIALTQDGHDAIGVDLSIGMVKSAKANAKLFGLDCDFRVMNANTLMFDDNTFDLIINRNVSWTIPDMEACYREWKRVLAPGGRLIVMDSNFEWNLFDKEFDKEFRRMVRDMRIGGYHSNTINKGFMFRSGYMETRPMLGTPRPVWDANVLFKLRFTNIIAEENVLVGTMIDRMPNPEAPAPMFVISAEKPSKEDERAMLASEYWGGVAPFDSGTCYKNLRNGKADTYLDMMKDAIPAGSRILDMACGAGFLTIAAKRAGFDATGLDSSDFMIEEANRCAKEAGVDVRFVSGDAASVPFEDGSFDCVIIRNSLWAFFDPVKALKEASRVLRKDGVLVIIDNEWVAKLSGKELGPDDDGQPTYSGEQGFGGTDIIDPVFRSLPLSAENRPDWDRQELGRLGMTVESCTSFTDSILDRSVRDVVGDSFMIVVRKG
jgi:ubiquinone/menaquinone biosynthesis C-methylase UbiE